jgi:RNA polymerase sigma factor (sigma-70 family)
MAGAVMTTLLRHIHRSAGGADRRPTDRDLLESFVAGRDGAAFAALLDRHGAMVLSVCRGVLGDDHAAEDAFQATFFILSRKADSIRQACVGGWLCQVARRVALRARARMAGRTQLETRPRTMSSPEPWLDLSLRELRAVVQHEVGLLPERYRTAVVLCDLEGKTQEEAARLLGMTSGAVKGRLERARRRLRGRLVRRGLGLPAGLLAAGLARAADAVPERLAAAVVRAAVAGASLAGVSAEVIELAREATVTMTAKLKIATVFLITALGVAGSVGYPAWAALEGDPPPATPAAPQPPAAAAKPTTKGETLNYSCRVTDKDTGKPIAGATVTVRRSVLGDPEEAERNHILEETKHTTDADGRYSFTIPPEQTAKGYLYIELDAEHPDYAAQKGFGYALSMIRKNEKLGGRPFFERVELRRGSPVTGTVQTPEGRPAAGVKVMAYSSPEPREGEPLQFGSFADTRTDAAGQFRLPLTTPGFAVVWLLPTDYVPSTHVLKENKRGDLGTFTLTPGIRLRGAVVDVKGQPVGGVIVNAVSTDRNEAITAPVADQINRSAVTDAAGRFEMNPLPQGSYRVQPGEYPRDGSWDRKERGVHKRTAVPGVFLGTTVKLKDGEEPEPVEVRAVPHVVVEAHYFDSNGKPARGHGSFIHGRLDKSFWSRQTTVDKNGKMVVLVPHGLEQVGLDLSTNEHGALRWRKAKGEPLSNKRTIDLGTLTDDVKGIEVVRYTAPILLVKVTAKDGSKPADVGVTADYSAGNGGEGKMILAAGRHSDVSFEKQEDGRFRSEQLLPDEEVTVTAHAAGYGATPVKVKLPEAQTKEIEIGLEKAPEKRDDQRKDEKR